MRRVVITGMGAVTPLGNDVETTWRNLVAGHSGVGPLTGFDVSGFPVRIGAEVRGFRLADHVPHLPEHRFLWRAGEFGVAAAEEALRRSAVAPGDYPQDDCGLAMGHSVGRPPLRHLADIGHLRATTGRADAFCRQSPADVLRANPNIPMNIMARRIGGTGPMISVSTACSGSGHAIGEAYRAVQEGDAELMLVGGYDSLTTWLDLLGFGLLGALTDQYNDAPERASRPFDDRRSGFVIGEGGVCFVLEELESARRRGAPILAEVLGYGSTLNAWRVTDSPPDGSGAVEVMQAAVAESGLRAEEFGLVVAHGTATPGNDRSETTAIRKAFGAHADELAVTAPKSALGHLTSASAALGVLVAVESIRHGIVPPTLNLEYPDRACDLDYVPGRARPARVRAAVVNAFAFGGTNTGLAIGAFEEAP